MNCLISPDYVKQNKKLHETNEHYGTNSWGRALNIIEIANHIAAESILDYGCGKAMLNAALEEHRGSFKRPCTITNYDPAIPAYAAKPGPAEMVVCTDVLEHVEPMFLENVIQDLKALTLKTLYLAVSLRPSMKTLPDGRNAHLIIQPASWWMPKLRKDFTPWITNWNKSELVTVLRPR